MKTTIQIATAADDAYAMPLAVMLASIQQFLDQAHAQIHVIDGGISGKNKERILRPLDLSKMNIKWIEPDVSKLGNVNTEGHVSISTYFRLLIPSHVSPSIDRIIYLDADLVVCRNLLELWRDIQGEAPLYAVQEGMTLVSDEDRVFNWSDLGISPTAPYMNAGVLGINLSYFRQHRIAEQVIQYLRRHGSNVCFWDQGGLNAILAEKWEFLDRRWNQTHLINRPQHWLERGMTEEEYVRLREDPFIVHFSGSEKPWDYICPDPRKEVFYDVLQHTDWADYEPPLPELERKVGKTMGKYLRAARRWWREGRFGAADQ